MVVRLNNSIPAGLIGSISVIKKIIQRENGILNCKEIPNMSAKFFNICSQILVVGKMLHAYQEPIIRDSHHSCKLPIHWNILDWTEFGYGYNLHIRYEVYYMCLYIRFYVFEMGVPKACSNMIGSVTRLRAPSGLHHFNNLPKEENLRRVI